MKFLIINGPNINMLGIREPAIYGKTDYAALLAMIASHAEQIGVTAECYQSNSEGALIDRLQQAYFEGVDGIVFNPGGYTHTSIALLDAVKSIMIPTVEVHISDLSEREDFRQVSYIRAVCVSSVIGEGPAGYLHAMDFLKTYISERRDDA
ncbi:MAG: 3-dehydroquinate dehydratase [Lachnospiraceae bacterium]|nr:3-dehydroquinate dehydratase [Lachnospiraceae bacterium]